jgi:hypothetical protein
MIEHASWCGYDDGGATHQLRALPVIVRATGQGDSANFFRGIHGLPVCCNLSGQFARWRKNQGAHSLDGFGSRFRKFVK